MKSKWYSKILTKIDQNSTNILLVEDKAGLIQDQELSKELKKIYPVIVFNTNELKLRSILRNNKEKHVLIVLNEDRYFPSDIAQKSTKIQLGYQDVFSLLDESALSWLDIKEVQELYYLYQRDLNQYEKLSYRATFEFVIKELFDIDPVIRSEEQLVAFLIKYYFTYKILKEDIINYLNAFTNDFKLTLQDLVNKQDFYDWLNQEWRSFIRQANYIINFNDLSIRYLLNDCFDQGLLIPIDVMKEKIDPDYLISETQANYWINVGITNLEKVNLYNTLESDKALMNELLGKELTTREWGHVAKLWSRIIYFSSLNDIDISIENIKNKMDKKFYKYVEDQYDSLSFDHRFHNAPLNSKIIPHILEDTDKKIALICFDGMSFKEWPIIKEYLQDKLSLSFKEDFSISIIPTVTKYSRRAIFAGKLPVEDDGTGNEEKAFIKYLCNGMDAIEEEIFFKRENNPEYKGFLGYKAVGLIYNFVDDLSHAAQNQKMLLINIRDNLSNYELDKVISNLLDDSFRIYFSSDHGNLFAAGNKYNPNKSLVEDRASRAIIYDKINLAENEEFQNKVILKFPNILGENYIVTMEDRKKFGGGEAGFTHGGVNIEEVIIPFIEVIK